MRTRVGSLAPLTGLRIQHCGKLWCRAQKQIRSGVVVAVAEAGSYNSDLTPSLGTSMCHGYGPKSKKKKKRNYGRAGRSLKAIFLLGKQAPRECNISKFLGLCKCAVPSRPARDAASSHHQCRPPGAVAAPDPLPNQRQCPQIHGSGSPRRGLSFPILHHPWAWWGRRRPRRRGNSGSEKTHPASPDSVSEPS